MTGNNHEMDFQRLIEKRTETKERKEQFIDFSSLILGLLLGAVISTPLNLLFKPISYQSNDLTYGPVTLITSASWWIVPLTSVIMLFALITIIILTYTIWIGLLGRESTSISFDPSSNVEFVQKFVEYMAEEADSHGMECDVTQRLSLFLPSPHELDDSDRLIMPTKIRCSDPNRELSHLFLIPMATPMTSPGSMQAFRNLLKRIYPKKVLEIQLDPYEDEIRIEFDPYNDKCSKLLDEIEREFHNER